MESLLDALKDLFVEVTGVDAIAVTPAARILDDLDIDSLMVLELGVAVNERWGIDLTDEDIEGLETVGDVVAEIQRRIVA